MDEGIDRADPAGVNVVIDNNDFSFWTVAVAVGDPASTTTGPYHPVSRLHLREA